MLVNDGLIRSLQLPFDAVFHHLGGIAGKDGVCVGMGTANTAARADGSAVGYACAFGNKAMAAKPYVVAHRYFAVGIGAVAIGINKAVLVGVHKCAVPRS